MSERFVTYNTDDQKAGLINVDEYGRMKSGNYATETYVKTEIAKAQLGGDGDGVDLDVYATKEYVDAAVPNLDAYATKEYVNAVTPNLDAYATKEYVDNAAPNLDAYATKEYVDAYATKEYVDDVVPTSTSELKNDSGYITAEAITEKVDSSDLAAVATSGSYTDLNDTPFIPTTAEEVGALPVGGTAVDSAMLGGKASEYYLQPVELLDNCAFEVAQAGYMGMHGANYYAADRWLSETQWLGVSRSQGVTTIISYDSADATVVQKVPAETVGLYADKPVTLAICLADDTILCQSGVMPSIPESGGNGACQINIPDIGDLSVVIFDASYQFARLVINPAATLTFKWIRLVLGTYTAETFPEYVPKKYADELVECMRYYQQYGAGFFSELASESGRCLGSLVLPVEMRCAPTTNYVANGKVNCDIYSVGVQETTVSHAITSTKTVQFSFKNDNAGYKYIVTQDTITLSADV